MVLSMKDTRPYHELGQALNVALGPDRPQRWLAEQLLVSQEAISQWVSGVTRPRPQLLGQLATILDLDLSQLLTLAKYEDDINAINKAERACTIWRANTYLRSLLDD